ncbi:MAG TPA: peptide-methionine (S)-S-oxide reductase [Puia sp.]|jgi:peptide-methionine (S)-S-oxide reductase|nr:peptide-methionine (S)-S-oxide reductase [Puia sp.]
MCKIGLGGSCHWCTEAIFLSLKGISSVQQGWIAATDKNAAFPEGVIVEFDPAIIPLETLVAIHLYTHSCTSAHSFREKYRSAVYVFSPQQGDRVQTAILGLQPGFEKPIITEVLPLAGFRMNEPEYLNYYYKDPDKPFCEAYINPKLRELMDRFSTYVDSNKLSHL